MKDVPVRKRYSPAEIEAYEREKRAQYSGNDAAPNMIGALMFTAKEINDLCDYAKSDQAQRERMHSLHGEMIARGCTDPSEVVRTVQSVLAAGAITLGLGA